MYKPTPEQIEIYRLTPSQGRLYEAPRAWHFRANNGRLCSVELPDGNVWADCFISVYPDGECVVQSMVNHSSTILVFIGSEPDFSADQKKIKTLTILPEPIPEEAPAGNGQTLHRKEEPEDLEEEKDPHRIGSFTVPLNKDAIDKLKYVEELGKGDQFRAIAKFLLFIPQYIIAYLFCASLYHGIIWLAAILLILFFDFSMVKSFTNFIFKTFKK